MRRVCWLVCLCVWEHVFGPNISKRLETGARLQWSTYRKWYLGYQMVTCPMTSRDPTGLAEVTPYELFFLVIIIFY